MKTAINEMNMDLELCELKKSVAAIRIRPLKNTRIT